MSKVRDISNLSNVIRTDASGNVSFVSGSTTLATLNTSGQLSGSSPVLSSSYASTSSYATNFNVSGTITATTLVVQTVTSSVIYSSGSNVFGNNIANTQTFTGSVLVSGSISSTGNITGSAILVNQSGPGFITIGNSGSYGSISSGGGGATLYLNGSVRGGATTAASNAVVFGTDGNFYISDSTTNTHKMFVSSSGNIGIGLTNPTDLLHLYKSGTVYQTIQTVSGGAGTIYRRSNSPTPDWTIGHGAASANENFEVYTAGTGSFVWTMNGSERIRITSAGSVLIGTTTQPTAIATSDLLVIGKSGNTSNAINFSNGTTTNWGYLLSQSNKMVFGSGTSSDITFETNAGSERMRITSGGLVGIGTSSPSQKLEVSGTDNNNLIMSTSTTGAGGTFRIQANEAASYLVSNNARPLYIQTNSTTRMAITSGGDVGIGTASPGCKLDITGGYMALNDYALRWRYASDANHATVFTTTYNGPIMYGYSGAALGYQGIGVIWTNSTNYYNYSNTTTWNQTSDVRIKQNINTITNAIDKITLLNPVTFDYTDEFASQRSWANKHKLNNVGFIAQEYENVFPDDVDKKEEIVGDVTYEDFKTINTTSIVPYLVKAIQELKAENDTLKEILQRNNIQ